MAGFNNFNPLMNRNYNMERLKKQRDEIDFMLNNMANMQEQIPQTPVNNIINTQQSVQNNESLYDMKVLNDNDEAENLFVNTNTIFIGNDRMQIKKLDGTIEKYNIKKTYPIDIKDQKIEELTDKLNQKDEEIANLTNKMQEIERRLNNNGSSKYSESGKYGNRQDGDVNVNTNTKPSSSSK